MRPIVSVLLLLVFCLPLSAHDAVFSVMRNGDQIGRGTVIEKGADGMGYAVTGYHVVKGLDPNAIEIKYHEGTIVVNCRLVAFDKENDVAVLAVYAPDAVPAVKVAEQQAKPGDKLFADLIRAKDQNVIASIATGRLIAADGIAEQGDSGSPFFNEAGELVGMLWWGNAYDVTEDGRAMVWAIWGPNADVIREQIRRAKTEPMAIPSIPVQEHFNQFCPSNN